jgi:hypothetical protein
MLPRLLRLIVVPLALIVDLEHSYYFPLHASNIVILLLMTLSFLTTDYFVTLEVLRRREREGASQASLRDSRTRVTKIVSVALAQSFALSLMFSIIFESNMIRRVDEEERHMTATVAIADAQSANPAPHKPVMPAVMMSGRLSPALPEPTPLVRIWDSAGRVLDIYRKRFDEEDVYFFGLLPRRTSFNLGNILDHGVRVFHMRLHSSVLLHLRFDYYPTLILTWTALGLFFGVFLEGFLKGERLRTKVGAE